MTETAGVATIPSSAEFSWAGTVEKEASDARQTITKHGCKCLLSQGEQSKCWLKVVMVTQILPRRTCDAAATQHE